jgi:uncharacterized membrane protein
MTVTAVLILSYVAGVVTIIHAATLPSSKWVNADRSRGYWLTMLVTLTVVALGIVAAIVYLVGVVPGLARTNATENPFRKRP